MEDTIELRRNYFIEKNDTLEEQFNCCLRFDELCEFFTAKYDNRLTPKERLRIMQKYSNRIKHVESCQECLSWCKYGYALYNDICCDAIDFPSSRFFEYFQNDYQKYLKQKEEKSKLCKELGHDFTTWTYHEWKPSGNTSEREWYRCCNRCGFCERKGIIPDELVDIKAIKIK